jgi:hypothetical protein
MLDVSVEPYLLAGKDWSVLRQSCPDEPKAKLRAAVCYYESYPSEIEARMALNQAVARNSHDSV